MHEGCGCASCSFIREVLCCVIEALQKRLCPPGKAKVPVTLTVTVR
jgi:hypothetical protein